MKGILTIAIGRRYRAMAANLARSLWQFNAGERIAIVTDDPGEFSSLGETVITVPYESRFGRGVRQKLYLDHYSPFEETLFLDADCLVFGSLKGIWEDCSAVDFGVFGNNITDIRSWWYFADATPGFLAGLRQIPRFNGGLYYFKKGAGTEAVFTLVRALADDYEESGLALFRQGVADEPLFAVALGRLGLLALSNEEGQLATPDEFGFCTAHADVFAGRMTYKREGVERPVTVAHFFGEWTGTYLYLLEAFRLNFGLGIPRIIIPPIAKVLGEVVYSVFLLLRKCLLRQVRPRTEALPVGLPIIPLCSFTQKLRSAHGAGGR